MSKVEDVLRSTLHDPARQVVVDPRLVERSRAQGLRVRRRRTALAVASAATAVLAIVAVGSAAIVGHWGSTRPGPVGTPSAPPRPDTSPPDSPSPAASGGLLNGSAVGEAIDATSVYALLTGPAGSGTVVARIDRSTNRVVANSKPGGLPGDAAQLTRGSGNDLWVLTRTGPNEAAAASGIWQLNANDLSVARALSQGVYFYDFVVVADTIWAGGQNALYAFDTATGRQLQRISFPAIGVNVSYNAAGNVLIVENTAGGGAAPALYALDADTGVQRASRQLTMASATDGVVDLTSIGPAVYFLEGNGMSAGTLHRLDARTLADQPIPAQLNTTAYSGVYSVNQTLVLADQSGAMTCVPNAGSPNPGPPIPLAGIGESPVGIIGDPHGAYALTSGGIPTRLPLPNNCDT